MQKLLGAGLIIGGTLVGLILLWLMNIYVTEDKLSTTMAIFSLILGFILIVIPQWAIGFYIIKSGKSHSEPS